MSEKLKPCPFCGDIRVELERDSDIFRGQTYSYRYPPTVAKQNHGFRVRCVGCGCQTCYWHYEAEATAAWNRGDEELSFTVKCRLLAVYNVLDVALGDSDPTDDLTDEEFREEYPLVWATRQISDMIGPGPWDQYQQALSACVSMHRRDGEAG